MEISNSEWKYGLFSCCESYCNCCVAWWCPCWYAVLAAESINSDMKKWGYFTCVTCILFGNTLPFFVVRKKAREIKGINVI